MPVLDILLPNAFSPNASSPAPYLDDDVILSAATNQSAAVTSEDGLARMRTVCEVWVSFPLACAGIAANMLALLVLQLQRRQPTTTTVLKALAVADTLILITGILLRSLRYVGWEAYVSGGYHHVFRWVYPLTFFLRLTDTWLTVLLTVDRYIAVCLPFHAQRLCTKRRTYLAIAAIILASFLFSLPRFFEYEVVPADVTSFRFSTTPHAAGRAYTVAYKLCLFSLVMYVVPMCLLVALNAKLLRGLRGNQRYRSMSLQHQLSSASSTGEAGVSHNRSVTVTVVAVVIVFIVCNSAAMTAHVLWALHECFTSLTHLVTPRRVLANVSNILVTFNSAVNFVIYCLCSRGFRLTLVRLLTCRGPSPCASGRNGLRPTVNGRHGVVGGASLSRTASTRLDSTSALYRSDDVTARLCSDDVIKLCALNSPSSSP